MKTACLSIPITLALSVSAGCSLSRSNKTATSSASPVDSSQSAKNSDTGGHSDKQPTAPVTETTTTPDEVHTPEMGSAERQAIMDALRANDDVRFQVHFIKVHNGWCWVDTTPLDKYGRATAEGGPNLLHLEDGKWKVRDLSKVPDDPDDPLGPEDASPTYVKNVMKTFPGVPRDIFPKPGK